MEETLAQVTKLVTETIEQSGGTPEPIQADSSLITSGRLDSLAILQLFVALQEEFEVELDGDDLTEEHFDTPASIAALIQLRAT